MAKRLTNAAKNRRSYKDNQQFLADIGQENQLLQSLLLQKKLIRKIKGNFIARYINWVLGVNPMLQIMYNREKLIEGSSGNGPLESKGGSNIGKTSSA